MVIDGTEIKRLDKLLISSRIAHDLLEKKYAMGMHYEICIPSAQAWGKHEGISVAINCLTAGHGRGLIELWDGKDDPIGNLTADKAMEIIRKKVGA